MSGSVSCPRCGPVVFAIELPTASAVQARDVSPPDAPLLLRVAQAARWRSCVRLSLATDSTYDPASAVR
ncbi:MAG: hypothetical protein E6J39_08125 [Chloroflexi bacterium]|nr:MAG: hypothetical protein E6J39_08125 [Chloroflexota bacterium]